MAETINRKLTPAGLPGRRGKISSEKPGNALRVFGRIFTYLGDQKLSMFVIILLLLVNTLATLSGSYLLRPTINKYIIPHDIAGLINMIAVLLALYIMGSIASMIQNRMMITVAQRTIHKIRTDLFCRIQSLPLQFFDSHSHGELMSRFTNDLDNLSDSLNTGITQILSSFLTLTGILFMMLYISPLLTIVTLVIVPFMLWVAGRIINKSKTYFSAQQGALGALDGYVEEMIRGQKVVKVFCYEKNALDDFEVLNKDLRDKATHAQLYSGVMMPVIQNLNTINFALTAAVGGIIAIVKGLDIGGLAAFLQYSRQFGRPVNEISNQYNSLQAALAGAERIFQIMDEIPEKPDEPQAESLQKINGDVEFRQVSFGYSPANPVLKNISVMAKAGQKIAIVGSTGAGKTTIMNLLPRFYDISEGKIFIDGINIVNIKRDDLRKSIAVVFQDTHLFTSTVMENIRYGRLEATDQEVISAAQLSGADSFIKRLPKGYLTILESDGGNLSQGQRQLLNIARATIARPSILILDEATSSIDTRTEIIIQKGIDQLMKNRTSFVIAHRLSTVRNADEIIVLEHGQIIERGNHEFLLQLKGRYYQLYSAQFD